MDRETRKNLLEMEYKQKLQEYNTLMLCLSVGILGFLASFVYFPERISIGLSVSFVWILFCFLLRQRIIEKLEKIRRKVSKLE